MRYLYRRGRGALRRVMHLTLIDPWTGRPTMMPVCGINQQFDTTTNVPWGRPICKRCARIAANHSAYHTVIGGI